jgi:hypothetical protein
MHSGHSDGASYLLALKRSAGGQAEAADFPG